MKPVAYRHLALKPWEFFAMTFDEFLEQVDGWRWREERKEEFYGQFVTIPVIHSGMNAPKKGMTLEKLLGRPIGGEKPKPEVSDKDYFIEKFNIPQKHLSKKGGK